MEAVVGDLVKTDAMETDPNRKYEQIRISRRRTDSDLAKTNRFRSCFEIRRPWKEISRRRWSMVLVNGRRWLATETGVATVRG
ncbi:hypothetical protein U1Q18_035176, partial [Sarracenia purpurea var. burkii]